MVRVWGLRWLAMLLAISVIACRASARSGLTIGLAVFPDEASRYSQFAAGFEARYQIHAAVLAQNYADLLRAMQAEGSAGRGTLDLVELDLAMLAQARPYARPLAATISAGQRALFPEAAWQPASFDGEIYFVPHRLMWQAMIYNRLHVPTPPATWEQMRQFALAHPGRLALKGALYEGATCDLASFIWAAGGQLTAPQAPAALAALTYLAQLGPTLNEQSPVFREMSVLEAQARDDVWIHFNWPFAMSYLASKSLAPQVDLSAALPAGPAGKATALGGGYLAIPISAPHPEAARQFLAWLLTADTQNNLSRELGWYGSVSAASGSREAQLYAGFDAMREQVRARPVFDCYAQLSNRWQRTFRAVAFRNVTPTEAIRTSFDSDSKERVCGCQ